MKKGLKTTQNTIHNGDIILNTPINLTAKTEIMTI